MDLQAIMQRYGQELGTPEGIPSNTEGSYELPITDELTIMARSLQPGIEFFCNLGQFSLERENQFLQDLMVANLFGISTRGSVLGLAPDGKTVILFHEILDDLPYQNFMEAFEDFCNVAETWHDSAKGIINNT